MRKYIVPINAFLFIYILLRKNGAATGNRTPIPGATDLNNSRSTQ